MDNLIPDLSCSWELIQSIGSILVKSKEFAPICIPEGRETFVLRDDISPSRRFCPSRSRDKGMNR